MIAWGLHLGNHKLPQSRKPKASTPLVPKFYQAIGGYDAVEAHKRFSPIDNIKA